MKFFCPYCDFPVKSSRGLRQHINSMPKCLAMELSKIGLKSPVALKTPSPKQKRKHEHDEKENICKPARGPRRYLEALAEELTAFATKLVQKTNQDQEQEQDNLLNNDDLGILEGILLHEAEDEVLVSDDEEADEVWDGRFIGPRDHYQNEPFVWQDGMDVAPPAPVLDLAPPDFNNDNNINPAPNTTMRDCFKEFCRTKIESNYPCFSRAEARGIRLMEILRKSKASLGTYDTLMGWFHHENGDISPTETLMHANNVDEYISREKIIAMLTKRYNMTGRLPANYTITLPHSKARVTLARHNAWHCFESLLTDPRVRDSDYNFHGDDPFAPPPPVGMIGELHTARAYYDAYQKFIKFPGRQVLLPVSFYLDSSVTGQFSAMPIAALKMAIGIHRLKYRNTDQAWRILGLVAEQEGVKSRGKKLFQRSRHIDSNLVDVVEGEGDELGDVCKAQDYHAMLDALLASFVEVQNTGFLWDLRYRGKTYKDVEFVPFVIFIKCDTDEADALCGSYTSRGKGVQQLCRYCTCPTDHSDHVRASYPKKTTPLMQGLVDAKDFDGLKKMSQQIIQNAWYKIRFTPALGGLPTPGVHGSCPSEMLHALLLGVFKYTRDCFFDQIGPTSQLAKDFNSLAQQYGDQFARQSDRDMPDCLFNQGIVRGKLMANEFRGILLVMAAVLRSEQGKRLVQKRQGFNDTHVKNWVLLLEMLLEWEAYLNEDEFDVRQVLRLHKKNRFIMYLIKKVAQRSEGMGWKLMKFHVIIHMYLDIWLYGMPREHDTGSNESGHKETKVAARLTQKNQATFDYQTMVRLDEFYLMDLAIDELNDGPKLWEYFERCADPVPKPPPPFPEPSTGGDPIRVSKDPKFGGRHVYYRGTGKESKEPCAVDWDEELLWFLCGLQEKLQIPKLNVRTVHTRQGVIFRGDPDYREKPWRDWAMIDWGETQFPAQIWCFVVIDSVSQDTDSRVVHGDIEVENGTYAVIECVYPDERQSEQMKSDIFIPMLKDVAQTADGDRPWRRKFHLVDVEAIISPLVVVPNFGGTSGLEYFVVRRRKDWVGIFKKFLDSDHKHDIIGDEEPARNQ